MGEEEAGGGEERRFPSREAKSARSDALIPQCTRSARRAHVETILRHQLSALTPMKLHLRLLMSERARQGSISWDGGGLCGVQGPPGLGPQQLRRWLEHGCNTRR